MEKSARGHRLFIRADADSRIGTGHVMRCIALAQACRKKGMRVVFVGRVESETIRNRLSKEGFELVPVANSHPDAADLELLLQLLGQEEKRNTWTVLDGYHFGPDYQRAVHEAGGKLLVIDDYAHHKAYYADILVNQNIDASQLQYDIVVPGAICLRGPRYALLRQEFLSSSKRERHFPVRAINILITLGGADPDNVTGMVLKAIREIGVKDLEIRVIVGPANPNMAGIEKELSGSPFWWRIMTTAEDMPSMMAWADLAISAGGSTCWELAFMGVPAAVIILAENQAANASGLQEEGVAVNFGWFHGIQGETLADSLVALIGNRESRRNMSVKGRQLVDGRGARRVAERLFPTELRLRDAQPEDCDLVFQWANDPVARSASFHMDPITWEEHTLWFGAQFRDEKSVFWIAVTAEGEPIAQIRFDIREGEAEISISLGPDFRGYGWGERLLRMACRELFRQRKADRIRALVKKDNPASQRSFERAGFTRNGDRVRHGTPAISMSCRG